MELEWNGEHERRKGSWVERALLPPPGCRHCDGRKCNLWVHSGEFPRHRETKQGEFRGEGMLRTCDALFCKVLSPAAGDQRCVGLSCSAGTRMRELNGDWNWPTPALFYKPPILLPSRNEREDSEDEPLFCLWQKLLMLTLIYVLSFLGMWTDDVL